MIIWFFKTFPQFWTFSKNNRSFNKYLKKKDLLEKEERLVGIYFRRDILRIRPNRPTL